MKDVSLRRYMKPIVPLPYAPGRKSELVKKLCRAQTFYMFSHDLKPLSSLLPIVFFYTLD